KTVNDVGVAGSGLTSQQVWEYGTRTLTAGGSGATAQEVWEYSGTRALSAGPGSTEATITVTVEGIAVDNVKVWITSDSAGTNVTGGPFYTNTDGEVDFTIDYGATYYVWREHGGYNFTNPQTWTPTQ
ncbi:hypothetical protein KY345_04820, partial [Candidatus Woesearchaeota archaeon]|nr:hypothetical protein [Candidatus Woesearchaeota archaeon]